MCWCLSQSHGPALAASRASRASLQRRHPPATGPLPAAPRARAWAPERCWGTAGRADVQGAAIPHCIPVGTSPPQAQAATQLSGVPRATGLAWRHPQRAGRHARAPGALQEPDCLPAPEPGTQQPLPTPQSHTSSRRMSVRHRLCLLPPPSCLPSPPLRARPVRANARDAFSVLRKATGAVEAGLMRCNLEEELAPDG